MADQDNFFRGASLGMSAVQAGMQAQQFKTNLAEKARQFDLGFDLRKRATDTAIARDRLAMKSAEHELAQNELMANIKNDELDALLKWKEQVLTESKDLTTDVLSMPPAALTGDLAEDAMAFRESVISDRLRSSSYREAENERLDFESLKTSGYLTQEDVNAYDAYIAQYGSQQLLPAPGQPLQAPVNPSVITQPHALGSGAFGSAALMANPIHTARVQRSSDAAKVIAGNYGIGLPLDFDIQPFLDVKGNLKGPLFESYVKRDPDAKPSSTSVRSDGATQTNISPPKTDSTNEQIESAIAASTFSSAHGQTSVDPNVLREFLSRIKGLTPEEVDRLVQGAAANRGQSKGGSSLNLTDEEVRNNIRTLSIK